VGTAPSGYKRAKGVNVSVLIDKDSRVMQLCVLPANLQDADGARAILPAAKEHFPKLCKVLGDKAYRGSPVVTFAAELGIELDGDSPPLPKGIIFKPMPMRWRIEQFFAWISKWRRIAKMWCYSAAGYAVDVYWSVFGFSLKRFY